MSKQLLSVLTDIMSVCIVIALVVVTWGWIGNMFTDLQYAIAVIASGIIAFALEL